MPRRPRRCRSSKHAAPTGAEAGVRRNCECAKRRETGLKRKREGSERTKFAWKESRDCPRIAFPSPDFRAFPGTGPALRAPAFAFSREIRFALSRIFALSQFL